MIRYPLLAVLALLLPGLAPWAQARADGGKKYALLVGVRTYEHNKLGDLKYTENDVVELARALRAADFEVKMLTSTLGEQKPEARPTLKNIRAELKHILARVTKHDTVLVGLAGHGVQLTVTTAAGDKEESFFCPTDARPRDTRDVQELSQTMLGLSALFAELDESGAGVKLLLVDACRNDPILGRSVNVDSMPRPPQGTAALFSCKSGERAFESDKLDRGHGVFFYHVLKGVLGEAKNKRGEITWASLTEYVTDRVSDQVPALIGGGATQTPQEIRNLTGKSPLLIERAKPPASVGVDSADALFQQGRDVFEGLNGRVNLPEAAQFFEQAQGKGHPLAAAALATMLRTGQGVRVDRSRAAKLAQQASAAVRQKAAAGEVVAMNLLGFMYSTGLGEPQDHAEAVALYRKAAERDYALAQANLGFALAEGRGVPRNFAAAVHWYRKAADQGSAYGQCALGAACLSGLGTPRNVQEGMDWLRKSSEQGLSMAQAALGFAYLAGSGAKDYRTVAPLFLQSAKQFCGDGMVGFGLMCQRGWGVPQNPVQAAFWYRRAVDQENTSGMYQLGKLYLYGVGVKQDVQGGVRLCEQAASEGLLIAQFDLAQCYENGRFVPRNADRAMLWYRKAAEQGHLASQQRLQALGARP